MAPFFKLAVTADGENCGYVFGKVTAADKISTLQNVQKGSLDGHIYTVPFQYSYYTNLHYFLESYASTLPSTLLIKNNGNIVWDAHN